METLRVRYETITSYLKKIEELLEGRATGSSEAMGGYYHYWERRIFNAITTMLVRGKGPCLLIPSRPAGLAPTPLSLCPSEPIVLPL